MSPPTLPELAVTMAVPDATPALKLVVATPAAVGTSTGSTVPRVVAKRTRVPSGAGAPPDVRMRALIAVVPLAHVQLSPGWTSRGIIPSLPDFPRMLIEEHLPHFIDGLAVFKNAKLAAQAIGLSFAAWLLEVGMFALFGLAFDITLSMPAWMLVMVAANVISSLPVAPSNIGAYEVAVTTLLVALGVYFNRRAKEREGVSRARLR